ncbi:hypothetical protein PVAP13_2NG221103 [Panicum virgatum]|uniref:Uncharacterized protein n=1 Tax=Panicum virgatum TaxID=38727 RepID=A0A8T0VRI8_PANVG|nr:hypothetical protein PVAP13_2NG221103 [Panicum virgatum]
MCPHRHPSFLAPSACPSLCASILAGTCLLSPLPVPNPTGRPLLLCLPAPGMLLPTARAGPELDLAEEI